MSRQDGLVMLVMALGILGSYVIRLVLARFESKHTCKHCGAYDERKWKYCGRCARSREPASSRAPDEVEGERNFNRWVRERLLAKGWKVDEVCIDFSSECGEYRLTLDGRVATYFTCTDQLEQWLERAPVQCVTVEPQRIVLDKWKEASFYIGDEQFIGTHQGRILWMQTDKRAGWEYPSADGLHR